MNRDIQRRRKRIADEPSAGDVLFVEGRRVEVEAVHPHVRILSGAGQVVMVRVDPHGWRRPYFTTYGQWGELVRRAQMTSERPA
jgi:hypothetical protein